MESEASELTPRPDGKRGSSFDGLCALGCFHSVLAAPGHITPNTSSCMSFACPAALGSEDSPQPMLDGYEGPRTILRISELLEGLRKAIILTVTFY